MPEYFLDTSALVKHYIDEAGSQIVRDLLTSRDRDDQGVYIASITVVEAVAALCGRGRRPDGSRERMIGLVATLRRELPDLVAAIQVSEPVIARATDMAVAHELRGYDAVQLAVALTVNERCLAMGLGGVTVVSSDKQLNEATAAEGLLVLDPTTV